MIAKRRLARELSAQKKLVRPPHSLEAKVRKHSQLREKLAKFLSSIGICRVVGAFLCTTADSGLISLFDAVFDQHKFFDL